MSDMFDDSEFDVSGFNLEGDVLCLKQTYRTVSFVILGHQDNLSRQINVTNKQRGTLFTRQRYAIISVSLLNIVKIGS